MRGFYDATPEHLKSWLRLRG